MPLEVASQEQFDKSVNRLAELLLNKEVENLDEKKFKALLEAKVSFVRTGVSINIPIYRARFPDNPIDLDHISSFSYPNPKKYQGGGRCHLPGKPVFYASYDSDTAIKEALQTTGKERDGTVGYLSKWQAVQPMNFMDFIYSDVDLKSDIAKSFAKHSHQQLVNNLGIYKGNNLENLQLFAQKIGRAFLSENHTHSSRICHSILYNQRSQLKKAYPIHGVLYPSVIKNHNDYNFAIAPFAVKQLLKPTGVWRIRVKKNQENDVYVSIDRYGLPASDGKVNWYNVEPIILFSNIRNMAVASQGQMPVEVNLDTQINTDIGKTTIGYFVQSQHWEELSKKFYDLGRIDSDIQPGSRFLRQQYISLTKPINVQTNWGVVLVTSIMITLEISFELNPVRNG